MSPSDTAGFLSDKSDKKCIPDPADCLTCDWVAVMELDLLLARQLQAEEDHHAAAAQQQGGGSEEVAFLAKLQSGVQTVLKVTQDALLQAPPAPAGACDRACVTCLQYEDELAQAMCLSCMPLEELKQAAGPEQDALARHLLQWFKHQFFTWASQGSALSVLKLH